MLFCKVLQETIEIMKDTLETFALHKSAQHIHK